MKIQNTIICEIYNKGNFISPNAYIRKKRSLIINLSLHFKKLEKGHIKLKLKKLSHLSHLFKTP